MEKNRRRGLRRSALDRVRSRDYHTYSGKSGPWYEDQPYRATRARERCLRRRGCGPSCGFCNQITKKNALRDVANMEVKEGLEEAAEAVSYDDLNNTN